jgi:hypothetical protein
VIVAAARRSTGPGGVERRLAPRFGPEDLAQPVQVVGSRLVNISRGGVLLEAPVPLAPESKLHLRLVLAGERSDVDACVRACVPRSRGRHSTWGVGLEFQDIDAETLERLDRVLTPRRRSSS